MGVQITFDRKLGDEAEAKVGVKGIITSMCVDNGGFVYAVEWMATDRTVKSRWFRALELVDIEDS